MERPTVLYVLNGASESSIPLEIAASLADEDIEIEVCSFNEPASETFGMDVRSLGARSQLDPRAYARLVALVRRIEPDVVHVHPNATGAIVRLALWLTSVELVTTEHNTHGEFSLVKRLVNGTTNALNDALVANSQTTAESLSRWERRLLRTVGVPMRVIPNGVDFDRIEEASVASRPDLPNGFLIGTAGRMVPQKNQLALLEAAAPTVRDRENVHIVLVGDGPLRGDLERRAEALGITERTHMLGFLPKRDDVLTVIDSLDMFVFPSLYEGFGVAVVEAMALRTPVLANDIPVVSEVVGEGGETVDVNDTEAFSRAIARMYTDKERREVLAERGHRRAKTRFALTDCVSEHADLYRRLVHGDGP